MTRAIAIALLGLFGSFTSTGAQTTRPVRKPAPVVAPKTEAPEIVCPTPLGTGVKSKAIFCDILTGRDPAQGMLIKVPPHKGVATLTFDLHNRQTYSEEQVKANRAFARYTASIGVLTMDNTLISRAVVQSEFRNANDVVDWIAGGAGPGGVKAVAPTGTELVSIDVPEAENEVSVLGEKLTVERPDGTVTYVSAGRPIALISNAMITYRPAPPKPAPKAPPKKKAR